MVEREITTTVDIEKEREVTETYLDSEEVTETHYICDACGEFCDERGGHHEIPLEMPTIKGAYTADIEQGVLEYFDNKGTEIETDVLEVEMQTSGEPIQTLGAADATWTETKNAQIYVGNCGGVRVFETTEFNRELRRAIRCAMPAVELTEPETMDMCDHCLQGAKDTEETLDTAAYEPTEDDEYEPTGLVDRIMCNIARLIDWTAERGYDISTYARAIMFCAAIVSAVTFIADPSAWRLIGAFAWTVAAVFWE